MNDELVYMVILQKTGRAAPSVAATLIEGLPDEDDPQRPMQEKIAQDVAAIAYIGLWSCKSTVNHGCPTDYFMSLPSAGADTVSERNENIMNNIINCILRQRQLCRPYSWPWHYIQRSRKKHKQKSMLWWDHIASQILTIVLLCHISMLLSRNR